MKQILFVYHSNYTPSNASSVNNVQTLNALEEIGYHTTLATPYSLSEFKSKTHIEIPSHASVEISLNHQIADRLLYYSYCVWLARHHELIFTRDRWFLEYLRYIPSKLYPPVIFEAHACHSKLDPEAYSRQVSAKDERNQLAIPNSVTALSPEIASDLEDIGVRVDKIVPLAADPRLVPDKSKQSIRKELGVHQDKTVVIYAGSMNFSKNDFELLFNAIQILQSRSDDWLLYIVGANGNDIQRLSDKYCTLNAVLVPKKPHHEVFKYLKMSDIGIVPLRSDYTISKKYASPMKMFEYLVSDLQVVASDVPAISKQLKEQKSVHLYSPENKDSLVQSLIDSRMCNKSSDPNEVTYRKRAEQFAEVITKLE